MTWLNRRYKQTGIALVVSYVVLQTTIFYLYNFLPLHPTTWTAAIAKFLPSIGGLTHTSQKLFIESERLSFIMAAAYLPGVLLGILGGVRELAYLPVQARAKWLDVLTCLYGLTFLVALHYLGYWQKQYYRNSFQLIHPILAVGFPFMIGFFAYTSVFRFKQLLRKTVPFSRELNS